LTLRSMLANWMFVRSERRLSDKTDLGSIRQINLDRLSTVEAGAPGGNAARVISASSLWSNWGMIPSTGTLRNSSTPSMVPMEVSNDSRAKASTMPRKHPMRVPIMRFSVTLVSLIGPLGVRAGAMIDTSSMRSAPLISNS